MRALRLMATLWIAIGCLTFPFNAGAAPEASTQSYYNSEYQFGFRLDRYTGSATATVKQSAL